MQGWYGGLHQGCLQQLNEATSQTLYWREAREKGGKLKPNCAEDASALNPQPPLVSSICLPAPLPTRRWRCEQMYVQASLAALCIRNCSPNSLCAWRRDRLWVPEPLE